MNDKITRKPIDAGYYFAVPHEVQLENGEKSFVQIGLSSKSETKQILVMLKLDEGVTLPWFGYLTPDSVQRTIQSLRLMGWTGKSFSDLITAKLENRVSVTVETDEWEGKTRSRIAWINDPNGPGILLEKPMNQKMIAGLDKEFGNLLG